MKQLKTLVLSLPFVLAAVCTVGCSQDELTDMTDGGDKGKVREVPITLNLGVNVGLQRLTRSSALSPLATYAESQAQEGALPRELTTIDPAQQVNDMRIYVFRCPQQDGIEGTYTYYVPEEIEEIGYYDVSATGIFNHEKPYYSETLGYEEKTYTFKPRLEEGYYYKFLVIGRDDKNGNIYQSGKNQYIWGYKVLNEPDFTGKTFDEASINGIVMNNDRTGSMLWCTELFSGILRKGDNINGTGEEDAILVSSDGESTFPQRKIVLRRAVAGLMMYVKNIPLSVVDNDEYKGEVFKPEYLSIMANVASRYVTLVDREMPEVDKQKDYKNLSETMVRLGLIDLTEGWGEDKSKGIFTRPADEEKGWEENSYMISNYIMPTTEDCIDYRDDSPFDEVVTFVLCYNAQNKADQFKCYQKIKMRIEGSGDPYQYLFPIKANCLYLLGKKGKNVNDPYPLTPEKESQENLVIEVIPDWDSYEQLEWK